MSRIGTEMILRQMAGLREPARRLGEQIAEEKQLRSLVKARHEQIYPYSPLPEDIENMNLSELNAFNVRLSMVQRQMAKEEEQKKYELEKIRAAQVGVAGILAPTRPGMAAAYLYPPSEASAAPEVTPEEVEAARQKIMSKYEITEPTTPEEFVSISPETISRVRREFAGIPKTGLIPASDVNRLRAVAAWRMMDLPSELERKKELLGIAGEQKRGLAESAQAGKEKLVKAAQEGKERITRMNNDIRLAIARSKRTDKEKADLTKETNRIYRDYKNDMLKLLAAPTEIEKPLGAGDIATRMEVAETSAIQQLKNIQEKTGVHQPIIMTPVQGVKYLLDPAMWPEGFDPNIKENMDSLKGQIVRMIGTGEISYPIGKSITTKQVIQWIDQSMLK